MRVSTKDVRGVSAEPADGESGSEGSFSSEDELEARRAAVIREEMELVVRERKLAREERKMRVKARERVVEREEARRSEAGDAINSFKSVRREEWDWVWEDKDAEMDESEGDEAAILRGP